MCRVHHEAVTPCVAVFPKSDKFLGRVEADSFVVFGFDEEIVAVKVKFYRCSAFY